MTTTEREVRAIDATIQTLEVSIEVIRVGHKQMTITVFRQLPHRDLIDKKTGRLTSLHLWGEVNYDRTNNAWRQVIFCHNNSLYKDGVLCARYSRTERISSGFEVQLSAGQFFDRFCIHGPFAAEDIAQSFIANYMNSVEEILRLRQLYVGA